MKGTDGVTKLVLSFAVISAFCLVLLAAAPEEKSPKPQYDAKGNLLRPADYRDWEFLSAGYGMNYSPAPGSHEIQVGISTMINVSKSSPTKILKYNRKESVMGLASSSMTVSGK